MDDFTPLIYISFSDVTDIIHIIPRFIQAATAPYFDQVLTPVPGRVVKSTLCRNRHPFALARMDVT